MNDLSSALPDDKCDEAAIQRARELGYPAIAPILDDLLGWTVDMHWPISQPMSEFLFSLGPPIQPAVERLLRAGDYTAKWDVLRQIIRHMPKATAEGLRPEFERLARHPEPGDVKEHIDATAAEVLAWLAAVDG